MTKSAGLLTHCALCNFRLKNHLNKESITDRIGIGNQTTEDTHPFVMRGFITIVVPKPFTNTATSCRMLQELYMRPALSVPNHKVQAMFSTRDVSQGQPVAAL